MVLVASACAPSPQLRNEAYLDDTSLLLEDSCAAPCWHDLIPGETAWGLAQDTVSNLADLTVTNTNRDRNTGEAWIEFAFQDGPVCCRVFTRDGETLSQIWLLLRPQITVGEIVAKYGEPLYITAQAETPDQAYVGLIYPNIPMVIYAFAENISQASITTDSMVIGLGYLAASEIDNLLQTQTLYAWNGYGLLGDILASEPAITPQPATE